MMFRLSLSTLSWLALASHVLSFTGSSMPKSSRSMVISSSVPETMLAMTTQEETTVVAETSSTKKSQEIVSTTEDLYIPLSFDEMVRQSTTAMEDAYKAGINRQILRILLPRSADNDQLLQYFEEDAKIDSRQAILVPPDESWQGTSTANGPRIVERSNNLLRSSSQQFLICLLYFL